MNFLSKLLQGITFVPAIVQGVEGLFGHKSGTEKKNAVMSFVSTAISATDAVTGKDIVDAGKFQDGSGQDRRRRRGMPERVGVGEGKSGMSRGSRGRVEGCGSVAVS